MSFFRTHRHLLLVVVGFAGIGASAITVATAGADDDRADNVDEAFDKLVCAPSPLICSSEGLTQIEIRVNGNQVDSDHIVMVVANARANASQLGLSVPDDTIVRSAIADIVFRLMVLEAAPRYGVAVSTDVAITEIAKNNAVLADSTTATVVTAPGFDIESMIRSSMTPESVEAYRKGMVISIFLRDVVEPFDQKDTLNARRLWMRQALNTQTVRVNGFPLEVSELPDVLATPLINVSPRP